MSTRKIYGPPGTGKTTRLINYVKTLVKFGTPIDKIGYFAFTKKAAEEAINRTLDLYPKYSIKDLKYFRTLHSLAFTQLGMIVAEQYLLQVRFETLQHLHQPIHKLLDRHHQQV